MAKLESVHWQSQLEVLEAIFQMSEQRNLL